MWLKFATSWIKDWPKANLMLKKVKKKEGKEINSSWCLIFPSLKLKKIKSKVRNSSWKTWRISKSQELHQEKWWQQWKLQVNLDSDENNKDLCKHSKL